MAPVLKHALEEVERVEGRRYGSVLLLDPTSPGRIPADVARALENAFSNDPTAAGVIAVSKPTFNPFWVGVVEKDDAQIVPAFDTSKAHTRRQDVPPFERINGALYLWRRDYILEYADAVVRKTPPRVGDPRGARFVHRRPVRVPDGRASRTERHA